MTYEEKINFMQAVVKEVKFKAGLSDMYYVICFFISPVTEGIEYRKAYFDDICEAVMYQTRLIAEYKTMKHYISSNIECVDKGGLLDD